MGLDALTATLRRPRRSVSCTALRAIRSIREGVDNPIVNLSAVAVEFITPSASNGTGNSGGVPLRILLEVEAAGRVARGSHPPGPNYVDWVDVVSVTWHNKADSASRGSEATGLIPLT
jgi:hypothetical protein